MYKKETFQQTAAMLNLNVTENELIKVQQKGNVLRIK